VRPGASAMSMDSKQPPSSPQVSALGEHFETALDRAARAAEPPDYDQLAAYVDGTLDDVEREIVESWLESDPELMAEVEDLRALHGAMAAPAVTPPSAAGPMGSMKASGAGAVLPFERKSATQSAEKNAGHTRRFGTVTVIMGAMAAALIGAVTWMAVRSARVGDGRPGAGEPGSQVARQVPPRPEQAPSQQTPGSTTPEQSRPDAVVVRDGSGSIAIDASGTVTGLTGEAATPEMTQLVADALTKGAVPPSAAAAGLGGRELTLMGRTRRASETRLAPLSPIATLVRSAQPVFRWSPHAGARSYVVTIYGPDFEQVMASPTLTETTWTPAAPLKPGVTYQWQVMADTPEGAVRAPAPPAPDARFRVIGAAAGKTLDRDLARAGSSQMMKGLLLAQAGVLDEAEQAFEALQAANPSSKRIADLLARVRERRFSQ
jgi:anti-sigma factor RsiW